MTKVSASTLARRASKTKNPTLAKQLRAQAAKMRREARQAKVPGLPDREAIIKRVNKRIAQGKHSGIVAGLDPRFMQPDEAANDSNAVHPDARINQARAANVDSMPLGAEQPGHGEIVGGYLAHMADELAKLARKKGGVDAIQGRLMTLEHQNRHDEKFYARQREQKAVQAVREEMRDKTVCGFLAVVAAADVTGVPPAVWCVNAFTVANLVDALKANGYTADGKR